MERNEGRRGVDRRSLLKGLTAGALATAIGDNVIGAAAANAAPEAPAAGTAQNGGKIRGVNLGSWVVLEKWITPSVFKGSDAPDEYTLCQKLGKKEATARLRAHQDSFITDDDFKWLAARGVNAVRLPIGYWALGGEEPFVSSADTIDRAFQQTRKYGISVLLDLHGAPGSQNGWMHSGREGALNWHTSKENIAHTLDIIERIAERYGEKDNLLGIELLNEPRWDVPIDILKTYYQDGYRRVRKHIPKEHAAVVIHDGFRPNAWTDFMTEPEYQNVILDTHIYQCYTDEDHKRDVSGHIVVAADRRKQLDSMGKQFGIIVGEWSAALDPQSYKGLSSFEKDTGKRGYVAAQITSYDRSQGWFYWTYKTQNIPDWSFRDSVEHGWLPAAFADA